MTIKCNRYTLKKTREKIANECIDDNMGKSPLSSTTDPRIRYENNDYKEDV